MPPWLVYGAVLGRNQSNIMSIHYYWSVYTYGCKSSPCDNGIITVKHGHNTLLMRVVRSTVKAVYSLYSDYHARLYNITTPYNITNIWDSPHMRSSRIDDIHIGKHVTMIGDGGMYASYQTSENDICVADVDWSDCDGWLVN